MKQQTIMKLAMAAYCLINASLSAYGIVPPLVKTEIIDLSSRWQFSQDGTDYKAVTLPHSINAGEQGTITHGVCSYRYLFTPENDSQYELYISHAGQKATVLLNDEQVTTHYCGYTAFTVPLKNLGKGRQNSIVVKTDNQCTDLNCLPMTADFNFCNGLYGDAYLLKYGSAAFTCAMGIDRHHVVQRAVSQSKADFTVSTQVRNNRAKATKYKIAVELIDAKGKTVLSQSQKLSMAADSEQDVNMALSLNQPHLWDGLVDPYLYTVRLSISIGGKVLDRAQSRVGFRYYELHPTQGFMLNGRQYPLHGCNRHQDHSQTAAAMTREQMDSDIADIKDMKLTVMRLAHYPHNKYFYQRCDEEGIVVMTEIPWVNEFGVNRGPLFESTIMTSMEEMIREYYNHPSICFWGISNELGNHNPSPAGRTPQGNWDKENVWQFHEKVYRLAKTLDPTRVTGYVENNASLLEKTADFSGYNCYYGWYSSNNFYLLGRDIDALTGKIRLGISEYEAGANIATHVDNVYEFSPVGKTNNASSIHPEEYQGRFHEAYIDQIIPRPALQFTTVWNLYDFGVEYRNEGGTPHLNDKGLIDRSHSIKKDTYYLYKAWMNDLTASLGVEGTQKVLHITSKRHETRHSDHVRIKVYTNCPKVVISRVASDGSLMHVATLTEPMYEHNKYAMTTGDVYFTQACETFVAHGYNAADDDPATTSPCVCDTAVWHCAALGNSSK